MINDKTKSPGRIGLDQAKHRLQNKTSAMLLLELISDGTVNDENSIVEYVEAAHSFLVWGTRGPRNHVFADAILASMYERMTIRKAKRTSNNGQ